MRKETTCYHGDEYVTISITTYIVLIQMVGLYYNSSVCTSELCVVLVDDFTLSAPLQSQGREVKYRLT